MITRRQVLAGGTAFLAGSLGLSGYAFGIEPYLPPVITRYRLTPAGWPPGLGLKICALSDIHAANPDMPVKRIDAIVRMANALKPDITLLLGDYTHGRAFGRPVPPEDWAQALAGLRAPMGVHAVLGNHDWWDDAAAQIAGHGPTQSHLALAAAGIAVYENDALRLSKDGQAFWLAGLGDQLALKASRKLGRKKASGFDDLWGMLAKVTDDAPVVLMAHEPDIFPYVPPRICLTLSGHTHGGQVRLFGYSPIVPSGHGNRYAYGHVHEEGRDLIVNGGLGLSIIPIRLGMPPEIVEIELGGAEQAA